jgi:hypothetical protein
MGGGWTFESLIAEGMRVTAFCRNSRCNHNQQLDLKALSGRFGPYMPAMHDDLVPRLRCSKCGGRQISLTCTPTVQPAGYPYLN